MKQLSASHFFRSRATNATADDTAPTKVSATKPDNMLEVGGRRGLTIIPYGVGDANDTFTAKLYVVHRSCDVAGFPSGVGDLYLTRLMGTLTCTLCTQTGVDGKDVDDGEKFCDAITWAADDLATKLLSYVDGNAEAHSPSSDDIAQFFMSDMANAYGIVLTFEDMGGGGEATAANALVNLDI